MRLGAEKRRERVHKCPRRRLESAGALRKGGRLGVEGTSAGTLGLPRRDTVAPWRQYPWLRRRDITFPSTINTSSGDTLTHTNSHRGGADSTHTHPPRRSGLWRCPITSALLLPARSLVRRRSFGLFPLSESPTSALSGGVGGHRGHHTCVKKPTCLLQ